MTPLLALLPMISIDAKLKPIQLFDGKSLAGWEIDVPDRDAKPDLPAPFIVRDKMLVSLGTPMGHLVTKDSYSNYKLVVEYRWPKTPGNSGIVVHVSKLRLLRNMLPQGIEVQLRHGDAGNFHLFGETLLNSMDENAGKRFSDNVESKAGDWNIMEVECADDTITVALNGNVVNYGKKSSVTKGRIALQSEGAEIEFRKVELSKL